MRRLLTAVFLLFVVPASATQAPAQPAAEEGYYLVSQSAVDEIAAGLEAQQKQIAAQQAELERLRALLSKGGCL